MRAEILIGMLALAGCETGIAIEVHAPEGTTEVALFLATNECGDCSAVQPPASDFQFDGSFYQRDGASMTSPVDENHSAWFRFQPGEFDSAFGVVLAVGLGPEANDAIFRGVTGAALVHDLDVTGPRQVVIELEDTRTNGPQAAVWESRATGDICGAYAPDGNPRAATIVVPRENPDCDEVIGMDDCDEFTHSSNAVMPRLEDATCRQPEIVADLGIQEVCMIEGTTACGNSDDPCEATLYCAPDAACSTQCENTASVFNCIASLVDSAQIQCEVPVFENVMEGHVETCGRLELSVSLQLPSCSNVQIALAPEGTPSIELGDKVKVEDNEGHTLTIEARLEEELGCRVEIDIEGTYLAGGAGLAVPLVAKIEVDGLPVRGAVIPLNLVPIPQANNTCSEAPALGCRYEPRMDTSAVCLGRL